MVEFFHVVAVEYTRAYEVGLKMEDAELEERLKALNLRMAALESINEEIPDYLLAAYRGYESAQVAKSGNYSLLVHTPVRLYS